MLSTDTAFVLDVPSAPRDPLRTRTAKTWLTEAANSSTVPTVMSMPPVDRVFWLMSTLTFSTTITVSAPEQARTDTQITVLTVLRLVNSTIGYDFNTAKMGWNPLEYVDGWPVAVF